MSDSDSAGATTVPGDARAAVESERDAPVPVSEGGRFPRGRVVGRFVVLDVLGAGASGIVYAAYDPELARQVALKIMRPRAAERKDVRAARIRMQREAQAMARLRHRNVVAVYDVGDDGESLYLAMELVRGANLRTRLGGRAHRWQDVLPVLVAAGRGLAAAHAHGLVHRDFKPENVLVHQGASPLGSDRICVSDFGLARPDASSASADVPSDAGASGVLDVTLTVEGDAVGTPAYMAPEQHRGAPADARVDQYAFAVVLYEAIYGTRPFAGDDAIEILEAKLAAPPPVRAIAHDETGPRPVPAWLRSALRRALACDPAERWPSMDALLDALEHGPRRRRRWLGAASAVAAIGAVVFMLRVGGSRAPCEGSGRAPEDWDDATRSAIEAGFASADPTSGSSVASWAVASLDRTAARWADVHRELCQATWVRGEQSPELLDARMTCLQRVWAEVDAALVLMRKADADVVAHAPDLVGELPDPEACLASTDARPSTATPGEWSALTDALANADALKRAGREREAADLLDVHLPAARELADPRLLAEMLAARGDLEDELGHPERAEALLHEAVALAKTAGDPRLEAEAWLELAYVEGYTRHRYEDGRFYGAMSLAAIDAVGGDDRLRSWADTVLGAIAFVAGDDVVAKERWESALALRRAQLGDEHPLVASSLNNLGGVLYAMDDLAGAESMLAEALAMRERLFGADHAVVAESAINLGLVHAAAGRGPEARAVIERALAIQRQVHGPDHPDVGRAHDAMANAELLVGDAASALEHADAAIAIYRSTYGEGHPALDAVLEKRAQALAVLGRSAR